MLTTARWGMAVTLLLAPLPFGSVLGWAWAAIIVVAGALLATAALGHVRAGTPLPAGTGWVATATLLLAAPAVLQLVPLPAGVVSRVSPARMMLEPPGASWLALSANPDLTARSLLWILGCGAAALVIVLAFDARSLRRLFACLIIGGAAVSFYGLLQSLAGWNRIFLYEKQHYVDSVTGTFINRNHFAGFMVLLLPAALGWLMARLARLRLRPAASNGLRHRLLALSEPEANQVLLLGMAAAVMGAGLVLSYSRAGLLVGALMVTVTLLGVTLADPDRSGRRWLPLTAAALLLAVALVPVARRGPGRLATAGTDIPVEMSAISARPTVWSGAARMASDHMVAGSGLGTFGEIFPRYKAASLPHLYTHAHQDWLQWLAETGLVGVLALLALLGMVARQGVRMARASWSRTDRAIGIGISAGLAGIALHGFVDFNLHIPSNALLVSVLLASLVVLAPPDRREEIAA